MPRDRDNASCFVLQTDKTDVRTRHTNLDIPGDLEIRHNLASADDLGIRYSRIRYSGRVKQQPLCARGDLGRVDI